MCSGSGRGNSDAATIITSCGNHTQGNDYGRSIGLLRAAADCARRVHTVSAASGCRASHPRVGIGCRGCGWRGQVEKHGHQHTGIVGCNNLVTRTGLRWAMVVPDQRRHSTWSSHRWQTPRQRRPPVQAQQHDHHGTINQAREAFVFAFRVILSSTFPENFGRTLSPGFF